MSNKFLILAGGTGTRLWPLSRRLYAKQFLNLTDESSLLQNTVKRLIDKFSVNDISVITNNDSKFIAESQLLRANIDYDTNKILVEPYSRNTFFSIIYALTSFADDDIITVMPSDHFIADNNILNDTIENAITHCDNTHIILYGTESEYLNCGYGYIHPDKSTESPSSVTDFKEKPGIDIGLQLIDNGYLINSGMMTFKKSAFVHQMEKYCPEQFDIYNRLSKGDHLNAENIPDISVDKALLERSKDLLMIHLNCGLHDVSSFSSLYDVLPHDDKECATVGDKDNLINIDSHDNLVLTDNRQIVTIGADNLVIADTKDALLVASRDQVESVSQAVDILRTKDEQLLSVHKTAYRPWGSYTVLDCGDGYQVKQLTINPGKKISLQYHKFRSETWTVVHGVAEVIKGDEYQTLFQSESVFIPAFTNHRLYNPLSKEPLTVIEVQTGDYLGEDDIIRIEDDFKRV